MNILCCIGIRQHSGIQGWFRGNIMKYEMKEKYCYESVKDDIAGYDVPLFAGVCESFSVNKIS